MTVIVNLLILDHAIYNHPNKMLYIMLLNKGKAITDAFINLEIDRLAWNSTEYVFYQNNVVSMEN